MWKNLIISRSILLRKRSQIYSSEVVFFDLGFPLSHPDKSPLPSVTDNPSWLRWHLLDVSADELQTLLLRWAPSLPAHRPVPQFSLGQNSRPLQLFSWLSGSPSPLWSNFLPLPGSFLNSQVTNFQPDHKWASLVRALWKRLHNLSRFAAAVVVQELFINCR